MEWRDSTSKYLRKLRMEKGGKGDNQQIINEVIKHEETRLYANLGNGLLPTVQCVLYHKKNATGTSQVFNYY